MDDVLVGRLWPVQKLSAEAPPGLHVVFVRGSGQVASNKLVVEVADGRLTKIRLSAPTLNIVRVARPLLGKSPEAMDRIARDIDPSLLQLLVLEETTHVR